jgi:hypothetical protein
MGGDMCRALTLAVLAFASAVAAGAQPANIPSVTATGGGPIPEWALVQRRLISSMNQAARLYWTAFTDKGGTLRKHGKLDDDFESFASWPLLYAIGGDEWLLDRSLEAWSAVARHWTYERGGMRGEFPNRYDMLHTSEGYVGFQYFALADPRIEENVRRARRFAGLYMNEDPAAPNYDPKYKIIRSPLNGGDGPAFHADGKYLLDYGHTSLLPLMDVRPGWEWDANRAREIQRLYDEVVLRGDVIMNLAVTGLITHAYLHTGEQKYKRWVLEYVDAWMARIRDNNGVIPDNVGLTGRIGEYRKGQWWGGFFGWSGRYSLEMIFNSLVTAAECAYLVSGDAHYLDLLRSQVDVVMKHAIVRDGDLLVPFRYGPGGWEDFRPLEPYVVSHLWHASLDGADWSRIEKILGGAVHGPYAYAYAESPNAPAAGAEAWRPDGTRIDWTQVLSGDVSLRNQNRRNEPPHLLYLAGRNPDWPVKIMQAEHAQVVRCVERIRSGNWKHEWMSQTVTEQNPVVTNGLTQATMGAPFPCFNGGLLRAEVRYFDAARRRPGLPEDIAALVEKVEAGGIVLTLVNAGAVDERRVIVQAGAFGEHAFEQVDCLAGCGGKATPVKGRLLEVRMPPGRSVRLRLAMSRYVNPPGYGWPW